MDLYHHIESFHVDKLPIMLKTVLGKILTFFNINFIDTSKRVFAIQYFTLPSLAGSQFIFLKYDMLLRDLGWKFRQKRIPVECICFELFEI